MDNLAVSTEKWLQDSSSALAIVNVPRQKPLGRSTLKTIESFLLSQEDVTDASVWERCGAVYAHVSVYESSLWDEASLKLKCLKSLGIQMTPSAIYMVIDGTRGNEPCRLAA